ncbi:MAG: MMPL family transporter [Solirubrobacterales bacterium]|nr:MMPL family transporter [Solirubrobacterales bacterium]
MRPLARWCFGHRWIVLLAWLAALVLATALHIAAGSAFSDNFRLPHTDSHAALVLLQQAAPRVSGDSEQVVVAVRSGAVTDPRVRTRMAALLARMAQFPDVTTIVSPFSRAGARQIAPSGRVAFATVTFDVPASVPSHLTAQRFVSLVTSASGGGVQFEVSGQLARQVVGHNDNSGLLFGFIAAGLVLFLVFGSLLAMALPLLTAALSLGTGNGVIGLLSHVIGMASFSGELALLIGLGVGVDYALFILTRYRQSVLRGVAREDAVVEAIDTSGRAVLCAGLIVCIAMLGMFVLGVSFLYGVAVAASIAVAFTVLAALTLLPALLALFGRFALRRRERRLIGERRFRISDESSAWTRWSEVLEARPALFAAAAAALMVIVALPLFSMRLGTADAGSDSSSMSSRRAYDLLAQGFGPGYNGPFQLVAELGSPDQRPAFARVVQAVARTPGVAGHTTPAITRGARPVAIARVYPRGAPQDASTSALLHELRAQVVPAAERGSGLHVLIGGQTAVFVDFSHVLSDKLAVFVGVVVLLSFLLLMAVYRSLAIPLTAAAMNLLSTGAALGIVTAIFQFGWGASPLGIDKTGPIEAFLPVLLFPIVFGLSMDYEVFLVSRIFEEWHRRGDNAAAVRHGLAATGRTITAAAAIMVLVFAAFVFGGERVIKLFGIGLASAVLLDALIVRSVLVPSVMMLLGEWNWKLPRALDRILPHFRVEGEAATVAPAPQGEPVREPEPVAS